MAAGGSLFLFGGFSEFGSRLNDTWVLELSAPCSWSEVPVDEVARPLPRSCHGGAVIKSTWVIVGGRVGFGATSFADGTVHTDDAADVWCFDFRLRTWRELALTGDGPGRLRSMGVAVATNEAGEEALIVYGGRSEERPVLSATYELIVDPTSLPMLTSSL